MVGFFITVVYDCHLCSMELVFAFVLLTDVFGGAVGKAGATALCSPEARGEGLARLCWRGWL